MKNIYSFILLLAIGASSSAIAQDYNKWSVGLNVGGRLVAKPALGLDDAIVSHYAVNGRYMLNKRAGLMMDLGYNSFNSTYRFDKLTNHYFRTSFQGVANLSELMNFDNWTKRIGLLMHGGVGVSVLMNGMDARTVDNLDNKQDWMFNGIIGLTPQIRITDRFSMNVDISYITNSKQEYQYDMFEKTSPVAFKNHLVNLSVGATFYLGKNQKSADFAPRGEETTESPKDMNDDDKDGVPNWKDREPDTGNGREVDEYGVTIPMNPPTQEADNNDDDNDGVPNWKDREPNTVAGNKVDEYGVTLPIIIDRNDVEANMDSTKIPTDDQAAIKNALKQVTFDFGSANLSVGSREKLAEFVKVLKKNPGYNLSIEGHTDNVGTTEFNQGLSEQRAKAVYDLLLEEGLKANRMTMKGYSESKPKVANDTPANRAKNRRVELIFVKIQ